MPTPIPVHVEHSPLMRGGGFAIFEDFMARRLLRQLLAEACACLPQAHRCDVGSSDAEEDRGGVPARGLFTAPGGPAQREMYQGAIALRFLRQLTAASLSPTGGGGTYSYYLRAGDFLALHRDIVTCDVAVITCLAALAGGGQLSLYPGSVCEPLSTVPHQRPPSVDINLAPGETIVLYGGLIPHELRPLALHQRRVVSVLCYAV